MTLSSHTTKIRKWIRNKNVFEIIKNDHLVNIIVKNIESKKGDVNVEILQFISIFPLYQHLEHKRRALVDAIKNSGTSSERLAVSKRLNDIEKEELRFLKGVLRMAHSFTKMELNGILEHVAESFFFGDIEKADSLLRVERISEDQNKMLRYIEEKMKLEHAYDKLEDNANEFKVKA